MAFGAVSANLMNAPVLNLNKPRHSCVYPQEKPNTEFLFVHFIKGWSM